MTRKSEPSAGGAAKEPSFEERLEELDALVERLESGELGLEESIALFERGKKLQQELSATLAAFERRVDVLARSASGEDVEVPTPELDPDRGAPAPEAPAAPEPPKRKKRAASDDDVPF